MSSTTFKSTGKTEMRLDMATWLNAWQSLRDRNHETVLLDGDGMKLTALLMNCSTGSMVAIETPVPSLPSPSRMPAQPSHLGMQDTLIAEQWLANGSPSLAWKTPELPPVRGKGLFTYPLGPVRADVSESLYYELTVMGDEIIRLNLNPGFKRRHIREWVRGRTIDEAMPIISRFTTTSNVHHTLAMALAVEDAWNLPIAMEVHETRTLLAELERAESHLGDLALLAVSTGLPVPQMEYLHLKETLLRVNSRLFGHRYLRDSIVPGGLDSTLWPGGVHPRHEATVVARVRDEAARIADGLMRTSSFLDRLHGAGTVPKDTISAMRPVGPIGRASGRAFDVRTVRSYAAYLDADLRIPVEQNADAYARFRIRVRELDESLSLIQRMLGAWTPPAVASTPRGLGVPVRGHGVGIVEAPRGMLAYRLQVDSSGRIGHLGVATPSQRNWPTLPSAMANGNILQDFPIVDASFALSVAGWDG